MAFLQALFFNRAKQLAGSPVRVSSLSKCFPSSPGANIPRIQKRMKDFLPSTSWADQFCFQSFMSRFGECNKSTILSNTRPLTQGRLKACQDLVFRSSACEGHFSRMTFILIKAPTHNFQEICCRLGSHWNQICHRKQNVSFPSFAPKSHNCDILKANLDGQGCASEKPFNNQYNCGMWKIRCWYDAVFRLGQETHKIPFVKRTRRASRSKSHSRSQDVSSLALYRRRICSRVFTSYNIYNEKLSNGNGTLSAMLDGFALYLRKVSDESLSRDKTPRHASY